MTFNIVRQKLLRRAWLIILLPLLIFGFSQLFFISRPSYQASVGLGLSFSGIDFARESGSEDRNLAYVQSLELFARHLEMRLVSVEIQAQIAKSIGLEKNNLDPENPIYEVSQIKGAGFISVYRDNFNTEDEGRKFISAVKDVYNVIVREWNLSRVDTFDVLPQTDFIESVHQVVPPVQLRLFPAVAAFILAVIIALALPIKSELENNL